MKKLGRLFFAPLALVSSLIVPLPGTEAATIDLFDWGFNVNGTTYCSLGPCDQAGLDPQTLPGLFSININQFDFVAGLGRLTITLQGSGVQTFVAFFDHDIDRTVNGSFNETGSTQGTPAPGQSWEIDEPGFSTGDIYTNFRQGTLDNGLGVPGTTFPEEVALAIGFSVDLGRNGSETIILNLSTQRPAGGFFLAQTDPDASDPATLYVSRSQTTAIPEPATSVLFSTGVLGVLWLGRRRLRRRA
ncbi:MAG: PEP-CTERM sorting domain-containing protein [Candidatus Tectimicrobiota bacterium]